MSRAMKLLFVDPPQSVMQSSEVANKRRMKETSFGTQVLPLMWAKVLQLTGVQTVDVELTNGLKLKNVPVASPRWVKKGTTASDDEATGRKDLPQVGAKVLLAFIDGVLDNPLVLPISGFDVLVPAQKTSILKDDEQTVVVDVDDYGWTHRLDKETGIITYESPDVDSGEKFSVTIDPAGTVVVEQALSTSSTDKNVVTLDSAGVDVVDKSGNEITLDSSGIVVTDKSGNEITLDSAGVDVVDKSGNEIKMSSTELKMTAFGVTISLTALGIQLASGDSTIWAPNILPVDPFTGMPHGGPGAGIIKLKGG